ncbi:hypothetical protein WA171_003346 [Blastocystis sp. BT1]
MSDTSVVESPSSHGMSDERFQELLLESRRWKADWIDQAREESEVDLWEVLRKESNILRLTNQLHPNLNQLKRLGTQVRSVLIIPPALTTLNSLVSSLHEVWNSDGESADSISSLESEYGSSVLQQLEIMQESEAEKLQKCKEWSIPQGVSIDANEQVNVVNIEYDKFLDWLKLASNHELYVRVKKFVSSVNSILPKDTPGEREIQSENLNLSMRSFVNEIFIGADIEDCKRELYQRFMFKFLNIMCYDKILSCLPSYKQGKEDYFLKRCQALAQIITFENLGHDNRHTVAQYKEFWDCAIEQLQVMSTYHNVEDKVICLNNAINILTRLLETIFKVVGADELMDGINIIVMQAQVPQLKLQLQMMDYYYEEIEAKRGVFESVKLRIRGIIAFIKNCHYSDFTKLSLSVWEEVMGSELSRHRSDSELSSDDQPEPIHDSLQDAHDETDQSVELSVLSATSQRTIRSLFSKKTKKIVDGKWMECLDPIPTYTTDMRTNDELVEAWKRKRYRYYKRGPENEEENEELLQEYRNVVRTVENLLFLVRR